MMTPHEAHFIAMLLQFFALNLRFWSSGIFFNQNLIHKINDRKQLILKTRTIEMETNAHFVFTIKKSSH